MIEITITGNLRQASKSWSYAGRQFRYQCRKFLTNEAPRIENHAKQIVQATVYDVYTPTNYIRTYNLLRSMAVYIINEYNLELKSDIHTAQAKYPNDVNPGYAPYVAGEGPGIGFLANNRAASTFPRPFHTGITSRASSVYNNLERDLQQRFIDKVVRYLR